MKNGSQSISNFDNFNSSVWRRTESGRVKQKRRDKMTVTTIYHLVWTSKRWYTILIITMPSSMTGFGEPKRREKRKKSELLLHLYFHHQNLPQLHDYPPVTLHIAAPIAMQFYFILVSGYLLMLKLQKKSEWRRKKNSKRKFHCRKSFVVIIMLVRGRRLDIQNRKNSIFTSVSHFAIRTKEEKEKQNEKPRREKKLHRKNVQK